MKYLYNQEKTNEWRKYNLHTSKCDYTLEAGGPGEVVFRDCLGNQIRVSLEKEKREEMTFETVLQRALANLQKILQVQFDDETSLLLTHEGTQNIHNWVAIHKRMPNRKF